jgi:serine/threonine protein phosphatase PrpC/Leucine-rich repeat (LRR) protein
MTQSRFLEPLPATFFDPREAPITSIEARSKAVPPLPNREDLVASVTAIRIMACRLSSLPVGLSAFVNITILNLADNALTTIPDDDLTPLVRLETLELSHNHLSELGCNFPASLTTLHANFNAGIDLRSFCKKNIPNLRRLRLANCGLHELPSDVPPWAESLHALQLDGNDFETLPCVLGKFPVLDELSFFANKVTSLDGVHLPQRLKLLNLAFNDLRSCEPSEPLVSHTIDISSNFISTTPLGLLAESTLRTLLLAKSEISGILDFELPPNITTFDVSDNQITELSERFVASIVRLQTFRITDNQIALLPDCFPASAAVSKFFVDHNVLETLPASLLHTKHLELLSCSSCRLRQIPDFDLPSLETLNLQFNELDSLPDTFSTCPKLNSINISFNKFESLPRSLSSCRNVTAFSAVANQFTKFPRAVLSFSRLKTLIMTGNKLTSVPADLRSFFYLTTVDFSNNHIAEYPSCVNGLRALKYLSLSHNAIASVGPHGFPPTLTLVDLSFNRLDELSPGLEQTACISLDFNPITRLDPSAFKGLHFLSLNGCRIEGRLIDQLPTFIHASAVRFIESIGNEKAPVEIPPTRMHVLDSSSCSFPERFGVGYAATLGRRDSMEDCVAFKSYNDLDFLCGVFDGHGGSFAAATAAHCLQEEVRIRLVEPGIDGVDAAPRLAACFTAVNHQLKIVDAPDGCTGAVVFIHGDRVYAAGVGDSRIVRVQREKCERLTVDAKPTIRSEYTRLREAGLVINNEGRVRGKLGIARALGDFVCGEGIYVEPDITTFTIGPDDDALIIACDGLWDMLTDNICADIVRRAPSANDAAVTLKNFAFALGSIDNISVIVMKLHPDPENTGFSTKSHVELLPVVEDQEEEEEAPRPVPGMRRSRR